MKRWGVRGILGGAGCWTFIFIVVYICAIIVYGLIFGMWPNADEEKEKESGGVERDVEAGLGSDASGAPSALESGEGQVRSCK